MQFRIYVVSLFTVFTSPILATTPENAQPGGHIARQLSGIQCTADALSLAGTAPTPTGQLASVLVSLATSAALTNPSVICAVQTAIPTSLQSAYSAYETQAISWYKNHSSDISSLASECSTEALGTTISQAISQFESLTAGRCSNQVVGVTTVSGSSSATRTADGVSTMGTGTRTLGAITQTGTAGVDRVAGVGIGALAVGLMGAVAVL